MGTIKSKNAHRNPEIRMANKNGEWILIAPVDKENNKPKVYWSKLYQYVKTWVEMNRRRCQVYITVGGTTEKLADYYVCYMQALKALNVVMNRFYDIGFALFDELGSYTILHELKDSQITDLFIQKNLAPLLSIQKGKVWICSIHYESILSIMEVLKKRRRIVYSSEFSSLSA